jgi:peptidoglycan/LPS O-acetylase OafA/YrhL
MRLTSRASAALRIPTLEMMTMRALPGGQNSQSTPNQGKVGLAELRHVGGLDGLRGVAVIAVILFHGGVGWAQGGFLGVEIFFVLSGFLITSLLVAEWCRSGGIALPAFWARRARRLLPAMFLLVAAVGVYYALAGEAAAVPGLLGDGLATLFYFSNWHQIAIGTSYFAASGPVSPFQHTWSLAIEEQFYVVWPLLLVSLIWVARRRARSPRQSLTLLLALAITGAISSAMAIAVLYHGGAGLNRVYYGTDTRASALLTGAALALWLAQRRVDGDQRPVLTRRGRVVGSVGAAGVLVALLAALRLASGDSAWLYPFGMVGVDLAVIALIAAVVLLPRSPVERLLSVSPLQVIGRISYGIYLWHFPLFLWLNTASTGLSGAPLLALRVAVTLAVSVVSYAVVEQPIRQRRRPTWMVGSLAPVGAGAAVASLLVASAASAMPAAAGSIPSTPNAPVGLEGNGPDCRIRLTDDARYGVVPVPISGVAHFELSSLDHQRIAWKHVTTSTFNTCPPKRIMVIGDSLAFTLALPVGATESKYGTEIADAAQLGCAYTTRGQLDVNGQWQAPAPGCTNALSNWATAAKRFRAQEIVIEMGYRDEFDWRWGGQVVHLGDPAFDAYVQQQINDYVRVLGADGIKLLFLSVPYTSPPAQSNGAPAPAASRARHAMINAMLDRAVAADPGNASVLNIDSTVSPGGHYQASLNGQLCRFDGIHFTIYCAKLLEPLILTEARMLLGGSAGAVTATARKAGTANTRATGPGGGP